MLVNAPASLACVAAVVMPRVATFGRTRNGFKRLDNPPTCTVTFPLLHYITLQMEHCWEEVLKGFKIKEIYTSPYMNTKNKTAQKY